MNRLTTLIFQYYRLLLVYNIAFSVLTITIVYFMGSLTSATLFWCKLSGYFAAVSLYHYSAAKSYFYFRNAGLSIRWLSVYSLGIDVIVAFIFTIIFNLI